MKTRKKDLATSLDETKFKPLTRQQSIFLDAYIALGMTKAGEAYLKAYPSSASWPANQRASQGSRVLKSKAVAPRVALAKEKAASAQGKALARAAMSKQEMLQKLAHGFDVATADDNFTAMAKLGELIAKLGGWITERRDVRVIRSIEDLTDEELDVLISGRAPMIEGKAEEPDGSKPLTPTPNGTKNQ